MRFPRSQALAILLSGAIGGLLFPAPALAQQQAAPEAPPPDKKALDVTGTWQGALKAGGQTLRAVFRIKREEGERVATFASPDQGATGIPVSDVSVTEDSLLLKVPRIGAAFAGAFQGDGQQIAGTWTQSGKGFPLTLKRVAAGEAAKAVPRPQEPEPPFPYKAKDVTFENEEAGLTLAGTLTIPEGEGPHPAVVLLSGSGPQNRNEAIYGHKPFLVLADYLTRRGVAVLRYDERGVGKSTGTFAGATTEDFASDARAALLYLRRRDRLNLGKVGLVGHSEGGLVAPMVAARHEDATDFLVLLAPPAVPGKEIVPEQSARMAEARGAPPSVIDSSRAAQEQLFTAVTQAPDSAAVAARVRELLAGQGASEEQIEQKVQTFTDPWFRYFLSYDPAPTLRKLREPVLALFGGKDLQVPAEQSVPVFRKALRDQPGASVRVLAGLNHLFQPAETGHVSEYNQIETTVAPKALQVIGDWMNAHTRADKK